MTRSPAGRVTARSPVPDDAEALARVHVRAWRAAYRGLMPAEYLENLDIAERTEVWRQRLDGPGQGPQLLVGTVDGQVAGFTAYGVARDPESGGAGELYAINVHPDHWRTGVGSVLLSASHDGLAALGYDRAVLWVLPRNERARHFYESRGWVAEAVERSIEIEGLTVPEIRYTRAVP